MIEGSCHCGKVSWRFADDPGSATACNCTVCRRYGTLWIYGHEGHGVDLAGPVSSYVRGTHSEFLFCPGCGCVAAWRALAPGRSGRKRLAVNLRLAEPAAPVLALPIRHFDGLDSFGDLPDDGRTVRDMWF